jgi:CSLREA domain-containing protein
MFLALLIAAILSVGLLLVLLSYNNPASAQSTTAITVNTIEDEPNPADKCSLREAITNANNDDQSGSTACAAGSAEGDAIRFALGRKATIELDSQLPTITDASGLTIDGRKAKITISGKDAVRVFEVNSGAKLTVARLRVADGNAANAANAFGGAIFNAGTVEVTNSTFSGNSADDGIGGAIFNSSGALLTLTNSTFSGNSASLGGGIFNDPDPGTVEVTNSTFSGNSANDQGGGIFNRWTATLKNTIVTNSPSGGNCANLFGTLTDGGYNIDDGTTCGFSTANNSLPSTNPKLADNLANNGGPTKTIALKKGSPAINAIPEGTNGCGTLITTDQRGVSRPQGSRCDIGAFEKKKRR